MIRTLLLTLAAAASLAASDASWGFYAHKMINRLAVFTLPPAMIGFYKVNLPYIEETSVNPDRRRYAVEEEGPRHYMDVDHYSDSALAAMPRLWQEALNVYSLDSLQAHGILPWHLSAMYFRLRDAFMVKDPERILNVSAELGHYVADAHVPLHATMNYNGQLTGQEGIHGLWESRLPELFANRFDFFVGRAEYIAHPHSAGWEVVLTSGRLAKEVLEKERQLAFHYKEKKYSYETRGATTVKVYASEYAESYHRNLNGMVEERMRASIKMTGDLWYTAWVDAGQPDLTKLIDYTPTEEALKAARERLLEWKATELERRPHRD